ncbi:MAG: serine protease [Pseudomonadota bacterium]
MTPGCDRNPTTIRIARKSTTPGGESRRARWLAGLAGLMTALLTIPAGPAARADNPKTIETVSASVVAVGTFMRTRSPAFSFRGTGFAVGDGTLIATNAHVVPLALDSANLEMLAVAWRHADGRIEVRRARQVASDAEHDLALLKIDGAALPALRLSESDATRVGEGFLLTGFPMGEVLGLIPVTHRAMVSALTPIAIPSANDRQLDPKVVQRLARGAYPVYQLDATAYPGNSGSPLYDINTGAVVGVINLVFVKGTKEAALSNPSGVTYAIPVKYLRALLARQQP